MNRDYESFFSISEQDKRDIFEAAASRLETFPGYMEKDLWVCLVLDTLYSRLPDGHPNFLFKGGTSLSKAFGLIERFSEDVDIVVYRDGLGFDGERDPTVASDLSNKKRARLFKELRAACSGYICGDLRTAMAGLISEIAEGCHVGIDKNDVDGQTLLIEYPTLYPNPSDDDDYVLPHVKLEAGARSALDPSMSCTITPYVANERPDWSFESTGIRVIAPERTYWDKLLILHGLHCGYRDEQRLPTGQDRISRHYYDAAMITATGLGRSALSNVELMGEVRNHNRIAFRQAWKRFEEAVPGSIRLVPQAEPREMIERDYAAMQGMILGDAPDFNWIMEQIQYAETAINRIE